MIRFLISFITAILIFQTGSAESYLHFNHSNQSRQNYVVKRLYIEIDIVEDLTYTTITADFYSKMWQNQEGELALPLPENATICEYAIDVNGKMKQASVVEKKKALNAYESIKARNVDPGIVEKQADNLYRIRVFPLLSKKVKRLKISYVTKCIANKGFYHFSLPIKLDKSVEFTTIKITSRHENSKVINKKFGLNRANHFTNEISSSDLTDTIKIITPVVKKNSVIIRNPTKNNKLEAYYKVLVPKDIPLKKLYQPKNVTILWDNSAGFSAKLQQRQLKLLDQYFENNPNTTIQLYAVCYELRDLGSFLIKDSNWLAMKKVIDTIEYDGAMDVSSVEEITEKHLDQDVYFFGRQDIVSKFSFKKSPRKFHLIDLKRESIAGTLDRLCYQRLCPINKDIMQQVGVIHDQDSRILQFICRGIFNDNFSIGYEYEKKHVFGARFNGEIQAEKAANRFSIKDPYLGTLLARFQLDKLIKKGGSEREIVEYASKHRLVTDYTSMIVLETISDYIRYRIPPREPKELAAYKRGIEKISGQPLRDYMKKIKYHGHRFAWHAYPFKKAIKSIDVWDSCRERFFLPKQIDSKSHQYVMQWKKRVDSSNLDLQKSKTQREFIEQLSKLKKLEVERRNFFNYPSQFPKNKDITVSFRGVVKDPKNHTLKAGTDLKEFAHHADSPFVDVYRNSQRVSFNLYSKKYKKTPLQSGDMIVVKATSMFNSNRVDGIHYLKNTDYILDPGFSLRNFHYYELSSDGGDPFSDDSDVFDADSYDPGSSPFDQAPSRDNKREKKVLLRGDMVPLRVNGQLKLNKGQWKSFQVEVEKNPKLAYKKYLSLKKKSDGSNAFFIRVATILYQQKLHSLARKVLSNIMANEESSTVAQKRYLFWLMHFDDFKFALKKIHLFDPALSNDDFRYIKFTLLKNINGLKNTELRSIAKITNFSYHIDTLAKMSSDLVNPPNYDIRIVARAETSGISDFIKVDYTSPIEDKISLKELYNHGFYSDVNRGIEEHTMKKAIPGNYEISLSNKIIGTYRIEIYTYWNTPQQTQKIITIETDGKGGWKKLHKLDFTLP